MRCLVVSDNAMHRLTLEHYVALSPGLHLTAALCDGVEAYDYLQRDTEVDLVVVDLASAGLHADDIRRVTHNGRPCWLLIEHMGRQSAYAHPSNQGLFGQLLCFKSFERLVAQALAPLQVPRLAAT